MHGRKLFINLWNGVGGLISTIFHLNTVFVEYKVRHRMIFVCCKKMVSDT